jgi:uncharacterized protein
MTLTSLREPVTTRTDNASRVALTVLGIAIGVVVGWDGSIAGQVVRLAIVAVATIALAVWVGEARQPAHGWIQLLTGLVGTLAGLGIGLPHLLHVDLGPQGLGGLVALLAGGWLLVVGAVEVFRGLASAARRLVALVAAVLVAVFVAWPVSMALYATNLPQLRLDSATPADRGLTFFDALFPTDDGVTLSGWYIPSRNGAAVVLVHGSSTTRSQLLDYALVLARHGYGVLLYDSRGHGRSGGRAMEYGWLGAHDVTAAVTYVSSQLDVHPGWVGAVGVGLGADQVLNSAPVDPRIKAVVADGATGRAPADSGWLPKGPLGLVRRGVDAVAYGSASLLGNVQPPPSLRDAVGATAPRPVLLVCGDAAKNEKAAASWIQAGAPKTVQVWSSPGAGTGQAYAAHPEQWEAVVTKFLDANLLPV